MSVNLILKYTIQKGSRGNKTLRNRKIGIIIRLNQVRISIWDQGDAARQKWVRGCAAGQGPVFNLWKFLTGVQNHDLKEWL